MWEVTEIGYLELKFLLLEDLKIVYGRAVGDYIEFEDFILNLKIFARFV